MLRKVLRSSFLASFHFSFLKFILLNLEEEFEIMRWIIVTIFNPHILKGLLSRVRQLRFRFHCYSFQTATFLFLVPQNLRNFQEFVIDKSMVVLFNGSLSILILFEFDF